MSEPNKSFEEEALLRAVKDYADPDVPVDLDTTFEILGLDSLDVVEICIILEEQLNKSIEPPKRLDSIKALKDLLPLIKNSI